MIRGRGVAKTEIKKISKDALAKTLAEGLNQQFKDFKAAHFLDGSSVAPTEVVDWISTGDDILDLRISNIPHGGIPVGKVSEIMGLEASGKSLLLSHLIAETQKKGGVAVLIDAESSAQPPFLTAIGVDTSSMLYVQLECIEDIWEAVENIIMKVREKNQDRLVFIGIDSIAGTTTKKELEGDYDKEGWATDKALIMSKAMRKITGLIAKQRIALVCTNQYRDKLGAMFGNKYTTSGGRALGFAASVRIETTKMGRIKSGKEIIGIKTRASVLKNRVGPPLRNCELDIYFDRGVDRYGSWLTALKDADLATVSGGRAPSVKIGELSIPTKKWHETLIEDEALRKKLYDMICDVYIMKYRPADGSGLSNIARNFSISNEGEYKA